MNVGFAQNEFAQPTHVVGKRINANGEVTMTLESNFTYYEDGKPHTFEIPDYNLSTTYSFNDDHLNNESTWHDQGHPILHEQIVYTYEDDKIKTTQHYWSNVNCGSIPMAMTDDSPEWTTKMI